MAEVLISATSNSHNKLGFKWSKQLVSYKHTRCADGASSDNNAYLVCMSTERFAAEILYILKSWSTLVFTLQRRIAVRSRLEPLTEDSPDINQQIVNRVIYKSFALSEWGIEVDMDDETIRRYSSDLGASASSAVPLCGIDWVFCFGIFLCHIGLEISWIGTVIYLLFLWCQLHLKFQTWTLLHSRDLDNRSNNLQFNEHPWYHC